jgi:hypothetical protein
MDSTNIYGVLLVALHCVGTLLMVICSIAFFHFEMKRKQQHPWEMLKNKFILVALLIGMSLILCEVFVVVGMVSNDFQLSRIRISLQTANELLFFAGFFMILSIEAHIWLLALRTHGLIVHASNEKLQVIYWSLVKVAIAYWELWLFWCEQDFSSKVQMVSRNC